MTFAPRFRPEWMTRMKERQRKRPPPTWWEVAGLTRADLCHACAGVGQERTPGTGMGYTGRPCWACKGRRVNPNVEIKEISQP